ncbi:MAG TPA: response regulator [Candidatus Sulfotelmatobacter sp.]|jgi:CheY-like chemotaxis protein|nr:response regulator [Candidatus Sulfotelmatobacter sp.]
MDENNGRKILVIEDEPPMQEAIVATLQQHKFIVITADNGKDGLALAMSDHPDLILLDIFMPKMDGLSVLETLRSDSWGSDVPIVILTNLNPDTDKTIHAIMDHKPAFYLIKSNVTLEGIVSRVKDVLNM